MPFYGLVRSRHERLALRLFQRYRRKAVRATLRIGPLFSLTIPKTDSPLRPKADHRQCAHLGGSNELCPCMATCRLQTAGRRSWSHHMRAFGTAAEVLPA